MSLQSLEGQGLGPGSQGWAWRLVEGPGGRCSAGSWWMPLTLGWASLSKSGCLYGVRRRGGVHWAQTQGRGETGWGEIFWEGGRKAVIWGGGLSSGLEGLKDPL